jgi:hypothetical protein
MSARVATSIFRTFGHPGDTAAAEAKAPRLRGKVGNLVTPAAG